MEMRAFTGPPGRQAAVALSDPSGVAEARRAVAALGALAGLDEAAAGGLALGVTEAATNIVKHANRGRILARVLEREGALGVEVLAVDKGKGIANVAESMRDGHSTAGSAGTGLGARQRATRALDIYSEPGKGTVVRFEVWGRAPAGDPLGALALGAVSLAKPGEPVCGDAWTLVRRRGRVVLLVVDGLGHGADAAAAAQAAVAAAEKHADLEAVDLMQAVHDALRPTRGAAAAVLMLQPESELCTICGVGNIAAAIRAGGKTRNMVSHNGILGHQVRKLQDFSYPFPRGSLLVAHSDGIGTHWDLAAHPGLEARHPAIIAAVLHRDHDRGRDDATVVAVRNGEP